MSRIMSKLKKLERTHKTDDRKTSLIESVPIKSDSYKIHWNPVWLIVPVSIILVGFISYIAGMHSVKGGNTRDKITSASIEITTKNNQAIDEERKNSQDEVTKDLSVLAFDETEIIPSTMPIIAEKENPAIPDKTFVSDPTRPKPDEPMGGTGSGDAEKVVVLTSAIMKATDNPVSPEEDELNKQTIQKLNVLGVINDDNGMVAIISGNEVREGDKIKQFIVDEITKDYVVLSFKRTLYKKLVR